MCDPDKISAAQGVSINESAMLRCRPSLRGMYMHHNSL